MDHRNGLAAIPLILGLTLMIASTGVALKLASTNQNLQNKAAPVIKCLPISSKGCSSTPCCNGLSCFQDICTHNIQVDKIGNISCSKFISYYNSYCTNNSTIAAEQSIPCNEAKKVINSYCINSTQPQIQDQKNIRTPNIPTFIPGSEPFTQKDETKPTPSKTKTTVSPYCTSGQTKSVGSFKFICESGYWRIDGLNR